MSLASAETRPLVTLASLDLLEGIGMCSNSWGSGAPAAAAWPSANRAIYVPIYLAEPGLVVKLWIANGATNGNVDVGLYNENKVRMVSAGSTGMSGASQLQVFDVTDTWVEPGRYYLAAVCSTVTTATFMRTNPSVAIVRAMGILQEASALPLPATATPVTPASGYVPLIGLSYRVVL